MNSPKPSLEKRKPNTIISRYRLVFRVKIPVPMVKTLIAREKANVQIPHRNGDAPKTCGKQTGMKYATDVRMNAMTEGDK